MRFLHTADWHLGRILHGRSLIEDQAHVLGQIVSLVGDVKPDALLVAGDLFDRPVASAEAMMLLDDVLSRIVLGLETPVVMISGNHDSGSRLDYCAGLLRRQDLHVFGTISGAESTAKVTFEDQYGPVHVVPFPFVTPAEVRQFYDDVDSGDYDGAFRALVDAAIVDTHIPARDRVVALAHTFVDGGVGCDSERLLSIGGVDVVEVSRFDRFCYAALGHLHRPQAVGEPHIRYAGSLLKYSGSEVDHEKSVSVVEIDEVGACTIEEVFLSPLHDLRRVEGEFDTLMKPQDKEALRDSYVLVTLRDKGPVLDPIARLREVYPYVLTVEYADHNVARGRTLSVEAQRKMSDVQLFEKFFQEVTGDALSSEETKRFAQVLDGLDWANVELEP